VPTRTPEEANWAGFATSFAVEAFDLDELLGVWEIEITVDLPEEEVIEYPELTDEEYEDMCWNLYNFLASLFAIFLIYWFKWL
jgi:hypothetical protein